MKLAITLLALTCLIIPITHANQYEEADRHFSAIALMLEEADQAFENRDWEQARRNYNSTRRAYEQFSETFPSFAPELVRFRISYCRNQVSLIDEKIAQGVDTASSMEAPPQITVPAAVVEAFRDGQMDKAQQAYASKSANEDPAATLIQAAMYVIEGDLENAHATLRQYLEQNPADPAAHYNMAQLIMRMDQPDFEKARDHYRQAVRGGAPRDEDLEIVIDF